MGLRNLEAQGYLPASDRTSTCPELTSVNNEAFAENFPAPRGEERVCFAPFILRGLGFPHPSLPEGFIRILRDQTPPSHPGVHYAYLGLRCPL